MIVLVSGATATMRRQPSHRLGFLFVPRAKNNPAILDGRAWAADNGAFTGFNDAAFLRMLDGLRGVPGCLWVAAPDVVGDAAATLALFDEWEPRLRALGFPVALVAQDGLEIEAAPWARMDALFVGGSTEWKLGRAAAQLVRYAKARGLWVHMGRVNTRRRLRYARELGCDSVDGTCWSRYPDVQIANALRWLAAIDAQPGML